MWVNYRVFGFRILGRFGRNVVMCLGFLCFGFVFWGELYIYVYIYVYSGVCFFFGVGVFLRLFR